MTDRNTANFVHEGRTFEVSVNRRDYRERGTNGKAFVWDELAAVPMPTEEQFNVPTVYTQRGENKELDRAWDRHNKSVVQAKTSLLRAALIAALGEPAALVTMSTARFSRKAGCSCGCSPGFILPELNRKDIYVSAVKQAELPALQAPVEVDDSWVQLAGGSL